MQSSHCRVFIVLIFVLTKGFVQAQTPSFTSPSYSVQVQETTTITPDMSIPPSPRPPNGFLTVKCINRFNSYVGITYAIGPVSGVFPFVLNSTTGNFSVTQDLVYATQPDSYSFSVGCYDNLSPNLSSNASVTITVIEVDKYPPVILIPNNIPPSLLLTVSDDATPVGTVIASTRSDVGARNVYTVTDMDIGPQGVLSYSLHVSTDSAPDPHFSADATIGSLILALPINRSNDGFYNPRIDICDPHPLCTALYVYITIVNRDDYNPMFSQKVYYVTYNDSTPPGQVIPSICTDQDIGAGALQGVVFVNNTTPGVFSLNASTGALTTNITMDYRRARGYTVQLLCSDTGGLNNTSTVYVTITPPPNYNPLILNNFYVFSVPRTISVHHIIGQITATDENIWATPIYSLQNNPYFTIDGLNGTIQTISSVYNYTCDVLVLNASATDGVYTAVTTVYIVFYTTSQATPTIMPNGTVTPTSAGYSTVVPTPSLVTKAAMTPPSIPSSCFILPTTTTVLPTEQASVSIVLPIVLTLVCGITLVCVILLCVCLICCHCWRLGHRDKRKDSHDHTPALGRLSSVAFVNRNHQHEDVDEIKPNPGNVMVVPVPIHEQHAQEMFGASSFHHSSSFQNSSQKTTTTTTTTIFHAMSNQHAADSIETTTAGFDVEYVDGPDSDYKLQHVEEDPSTGREYRVGPVLKAMLQKWDSTEEQLVVNKKDNVSMSSL